MKDCLWITVLAAASCLALAPRVSRSASQPQQPAQQVEVGVGPHESALATSPAPSPDADNETFMSSLGYRGLSVSSSEPALFWTETVDLEGYGKVASTDFLYDSSRNILYAYRTDDFTCSNGESGRGEILQAVYTKGNHAKPVGSGWYVVSLDAGKCGVSRVGDYGCRFDAVGNPTECGHAVINHEKGDIAIKRE